MRVVRTKSLGVAPLLIPVATGAAAGAGAGIVQSLLPFLSNFLQRRRAAPATACPADARTCPDGTVLTRTGPDCAFPECPVVETPWYEKPQVLIAGALAVVLLVVLVKK